MAEPYELQLDADLPAGSGAAANALAPSDSLAKRRNMRPLSVTPVSPSARELAAAAPPPALPPLDAMPAPAAAAPPASAVPPPMTARAGGARQPAVPVYEPPMSARRRASLAPPVLADYPPPPSSPMTMLSLAAPEIAGCGSAAPPLSMLHPPAAPSGRVMLMAPATPSALRLDVVGMVTPRSWGKLYAAPPTAFDPWGAHEWATPDITPASPSSGAPPWLGSLHDSVGSPVVGASPPPQRKFSTAAFLPSFSGGGASPTILPHEPYTTTAASAAAATAAERGIFGMLSLASPTLSPQYGVPPPPMSPSASMSPSGASPNNATPGGSAASARPMPLMARRNSCRDLNLPLVIRERQQMMQHQRRNSACQFQLGGLAAAALAHRAAFGTLPPGMAAEAHQVASAQPRQSPLSCVVDNMKDMSLSDDVTMRDSQQAPPPMQHPLPQQPPQQHMQPQHHRPKKEIMEVVDVELEGEQPQTQPHPQRDEATKGAARETPKSATAAQQIAQEAAPSKFSPLRSTPITPRTAIGIHDFKVGQPLYRRGPEGVFLARKTAAPSEVYAVKVLHKDALETKNTSNLCSTFDAIDNPFVVKMYHTFASGDYVRVILDYVSEGDLLSLLRRAGTFPEETARDYLAEIVLAVEYLHGIGTVHRDIKPENILVGANGHVKLTDFGVTEWAYPVDTLDAMRLGQNTEGLLMPNCLKNVEYAAPELILGRQHGEEVDWWSLGCILFEFIVGAPPFHGETPRQTIDNISNRRLTWSDLMSAESRDLIDGLLTVSPQLRLGSGGALEIKQHPFFRGVNWEALRQDLDRWVVPDTSVLLEDSDDEDDAAASSPQTTGAAATVVIDMEGQAGASHCSEECLGAST